MVHIRIKMINVATVQNAGSVNIGNTLNLVSSIPGQGLLPSSERGQISIPLPTPSGPSQNGKQA